MGMKLAEIPHEVVATSEIDKFAIKAYEAIHGHNPNLGSIVDIKGRDLPKEIDIMTYSFPCTDLSKAGKQKGLNNTRSGLVYEVLRILAELKDIGNLPKVLIMENVVDLVQSKFIKEFGEIQLEIEQLGYTNFTKKLNAKDYGIAQNRDRVFMVSILGEWNYNFPKPFELEYRLKDYSEESVDEKYYISDKFLKYVKGDSNGWERQFRPLNSKSSHSHIITTREGNVAESTYISDSIAIPEATKQGYALAKHGDSVNLEQPNSETRRGRVGKGSVNTLTTSCNQGVVVVSDTYSTKSMEKIKNNITNIENLSKTITANPQRATIDSATLVRENLRIRKLTPRETGRLMGMNDTQIDKQEQVVSNSQMYKQHGNGIVAQVIGLIIGMAYYDNEMELRNKVMKNSHLWIKEKEKENDN